MSCTKISTTELSIEVGGQYSKIMHRISLLAVLCL
jgi:hypothetical protein